MKDPRWTKESDWLVGFAVGAGLVLILFLSLDISARENALENWAALVTAFATIAAGLIGGLLALRSAQGQISHNQDLQEEIRLRTLRAERSFLPVALSEMSNFALKKIQDCVDTSGFDPEHLINAPERLEPSIFTSLKECIRNADPTSANHLATLIKIYQVRLAWERDNLGLIEQGPTPQTPEGTQRIYHALDWATFYAICSTAFPYSRSNQADAAMPIEINAPQIRSAFSVAHVYPENYTDLEHSLNNFIARKSYKNRLS